MPNDDGLDNPETDPERDAFNRWPFSKRLADLIAGFDTTNGAPVIGIFGKWGYGKSTVLNYIKRELKTTYSETVVAYEFNPWLFTNQEELVAAFLVSLTAELKVSLGTRGKQFGKWLEKSSGLFGMIPFGIGSGAAKLTEQIGKDLANDPLSSRRDRAFEIMRQATRTVVVLIDDLDRLDPDEILTMLKLVRLNGNLPRVVYVLAFDDTMVARAVGAKYGSGLEAGRQFLEKIIQYPFTLPAVGQDRLVALVVKQAREACAAAGVALSEDEWRAFGNLMDAHLSRRLNTPRQAIRYANALRFALPMLSGLVNPFDQMLIEGLRVLFPEVYALVRDDARSFTFLSENGTVRVLGSFSADDAMMGAPDTEVAAAVAIVKELFPGGPGRPKSIARLQYFDRYFSYAVSREEILESELAETVRTARDDLELSAALATLAQAGPPRLIRAVSDLRPDLDPEHLGVLCRALARIGGRFISDRRALLAQSTEPTFDPLAKQAVNLLAGLILEIPNSGGLRERAVLGVIELADPVEFAIVVARHLRQVLFSRDKPARESGRANEPGEDEISEEAKQAFGELLARRIRALATANPDLIFTRPDGPRIIDEWYGDNSADLRQWLEERFEGEPAEALRFFNLIDEEKDGRYSFLWYPLEMIVSPKVLTNGLIAALEAAPNAGDPQLRARVGRFLGPFNPGSD
jgi:KAP family P-loop domain